MNRTESKKIDVFLTVNRSTIDEYFNPHDPSPIYKRQLKQDVVLYISDAVSTYNRHSVIRYKISCDKTDKELVEPFMHAVNRHYRVKETLVKKEFEKFKKRTYKLLIMSLAAVMVCHGFLPLLNLEEHGIGATVINSVDVFSWVVLWKPIERLIFYWNPFLKEMSLYHKLSNAEVIVMEYASAALEMEPKLRASA